MKLTNLKLGIGVPLSYPQVPSAFFDSFIAMEKPGYFYLRTSTGPIDDMRNNLVREALNIGCTHLIMMDADQIYPVDTIPRLLSHRKPVVGCLVYRRYPPFDPLMLRGKINSYYTVTEWEPGELVEVDATGTGCVLFEMSVFKKMKPPWFRFRLSNGKPVGEDIGFCSDLKAAGYPIHVDTGVVCGHLSNMIVNGNTWKLYRKLKEAEKAHDVQHGVVKTVAS